MAHEVPLKLLVTNWNRIRKAKVLKFKKRYFLEILTNWSENYTILKQIFDYIMHKWQKRQLQELFCQIVNFLL